MTPSAPAVLAPAVQLNGPLLNLSIPEEEQNTYIWWAVMCAICAANVAYVRTAFARAAAPQGPPDMCAASHHHHHHTPPPGRG